MRPGNTGVDRDDELRLACFLALDALQVRFGSELPYRGGLDQGFVFQGRRVPFMNRQKGIHRAAIQRGPAALSVMTSYKSPYDDEESEDGVWYAYRTGSVELADNRALLAAGDLAVPLVYFLGTRPGWFQPSYPSYVIDDDRSVRRALVAPGRLDEQTHVPFLIEDEVARSYAVRETRVRLHQARFRGLLLPPYRERCAICRLREVRLLDAAHIVPDHESEGVAAVRNGITLCTIHHRAFDANLIGISPNYDIRVSQRLLDDEDGPMLDILKAAHGRVIELPHRPANRPEPDLLAQRFATFASA